MDSLPPSISVLVVDALFDSTDINRDHPSFASLIGIVSHAPALRDNFRKFATEDAGARVVARSSGSGPTHDLSLCRVRMRRWRGGLRTVCRQVPATLHPRTERDGIRGPGAEWELLRNFKAMRAKYAPPHRVCVAPPVIVRIPAPVALCRARYSPLARSSSPLWRNDWNGQVTSSRAASNLTTFRICSMWSWSKCE